MPFETMFYQGAAGLWRTLIVGVLAYTALVLLLRTTGKRTLSKLNAFDLVVTVALGSTLATVLLSKDVALAEGLLAFGVLIGLQFAVTWTSLRSPRFESVIKAEPRLLLYKGRFLDNEMRRERVTRDEIMAAIRQQGHAGAEATRSVVLETDGSLSVVTGEGDARPADLTAQG